MSLRILKASAGSGKTYSLTESYIRYCLDNRYGLDYSNILAITFTNKASAEMKDRIVGLLFVLSKEPLKYPGIEGLRDDLKLSVQEIQHRCTQILYRILKEFDHFTITTIDSFFTRLYSSMTLDLFGDVPGEITLDEDKALDYAADQVIAECQVDQELRDIVLDMLQEKIRKGEGVGLKNSLTKLGKELFNDEFLRLRQKSHYVEPAKDFHEALTKALDIIEHEFQTYRKNLADLLRIGGMAHEDFYSKFTLSILNKESLGALLELKSFERITDPDQWFTKTNRDAMMSKVAPIERKLADLGQEFYDFAVKNLSNYNTYTLVLKNYGAYRVLRFLYQAMQEYLQARRLNFLSEINFKINQNLSEDDSMIIYEKIGQRIRAIMIDEFQDTSQIQWDNLAPLIQNNLAEGFPNLVVGDVKQAIYRFRNGNWEIMEIQVPKFKQRWMEEGENLVDHLGFNWRSSPEIVAFNNDFFADLSEKVSQLLLGYKTANIPNSPSPGMPSELYEQLDAIAEAPKHVYGNAKQKVPENKSTHPGYVEVDYWVYPKKTESEDLLYQRMLWLKNTLLELFSDGFVGEDIGILARGKSELATLSHHLTQWAEEDRRFRYSSDDSLKLDLSDAIQMLIAALKVKAGIDVRINEMVFSNYRIKLNLHPSADSGWSGSLPGVGPASDGALDSELIRSAGIEQLSLFFESIIRHTGLNTRTGQWPYLLNFIEEVKKFEMQNGADVPLFLKEWDDRIRKLQIQMSDDREKIRMFTIHKSKGLEFEVVIMPFGEWNFETKGHETILWVQDYQDNILKLAGPLPVNYTSDLLQSSFDYAFMGEYLRNVMDNLNLLYVAMTRPRHRLYIRLQEQEGKKKTNTDHTKKPLNNTLELFHLRYPDLGLGTITKGVKTPKPHSDDTGDQPLKVGMKSYPIRQSSLPLQLKPTFDGSLVESIGRGLIVHGLLENLKSYRDIQTAVSKAILAGEIRESERDEWTKQLRDITDYEPVRDFYRDHWNVHNEQSIMVLGGGEYRPDRVQEDGNQYVVIDYKTGTPTSSHLKQVSHYKSIVEKMVNLPVRSFIYYPLIPKLVEAN